MNNKTIEYQTRDKIKSLLTLTDSKQIKSRIERIVRTLWREKICNFKHENFERIMWDITLYSDIDGNVEITNLKDLDIVINSNLPKFMEESEDFSQALKKLSDLGTSLDTKNTVKKGFINAYLSIPLEFKFNDEKNIIDFKIPNPKDVEFFLREYILWIRSEAFTAYKMVFEKN